jgi:hypothetical protein
MKLNRRPPRITASHALSLAVGTIVALALANSLVHGVVDVILSAVILITFFACLRALALRDERRRPRDSNERGST